MRRRHKGQKTPRPARFSHPCGCWYCVPDGRRHRWKTRKYRAAQAVED